MSAYDNDWALDFCLYCDKQTNTAEPYCSQACRMADLEKPGHLSTSTCTSSSSGSSTHSKSTTSLSRSGNHFRLAPPVSFESYRHRTSSKYESSSSTSRSGRSSCSSREHDCSSRPALQYRTTYNVHHSSTSSSSSSSRLNNSSSRSSLSSNSSTRSNQGLTQADLTQLQGYANAFDQVRDLKRRTTTG